jgi:hypothetical protein
MKANWRCIVAGGCCLAALAVASLSGCTINTDGPPTQVDLVDAQGYHHMGYYDSYHDWHGGYYDAQHQHHDDPHDWRQ